MEKKKPQKKKFLGMPMNWNTKQPLRNLWNPKNKSIFPPKSFGIGWTINFHALLKKLGLVK